LMEKYRNDILENSDKLYSKFQKTRIDSINNKNIARKAII